MWVSARGDVETYASEALQSRLDDWFVKGGIADEAKELVKVNAGKGGSGEEMRVFEDSDEDVGEGEDGEQGGEEGESTVDVFGDITNSGAGQSSTLSTAEVGLTMDGVKSSKLGGVGGKARPLAPLNTAMANQHFLRSRGSWSNSNVNDDMIAPRSAPLFPSSSSSFPHSTDDAPRTSTPLLLHSSTATSSRLLSRNSLTSSTTPLLPPSSSFTSSSSTTPLYEITLSTLASRTAFLELRFGQLQQGVCKTVAKAWIKIIEPKKQTRCPYNKGEAGKPEWWPAGVRHKEPDHLMKPERHALLLTILRSPKVKVARLQLATAEVVALIKADKVSLLMDVYRIAREEERLRERKAKDGEGRSKVQMEKKGTKRRKKSRSRLAPWKAGVRSKME